MGLLAIFQGWEGKKNRLAELRKKGKIPGGGESRSELPGEVCRDPYLHLFTEAGEGHGRRGGRLRKTRPLD